MSAKQVIKALRISDINISEITVGSKKIGKIVPIFYKNKPLIFQTPFIEVIGGLKKTSFDNISQIDTLFKGDNKNKIDAWYQFIENLENHITNQVINVGTNWFTSNNVTIKSLIKSLDTDKNYIMSNGL